MKRVSEIDEEINKLDNKRQLLVIERNNALVEIISEIREKHQVVYGAYFEKKQDYFHPDFIFKTRKEAEEFYMKDMFGKTFPREVRAIAVEELSNSQLINLR
jgi:hypothetical protein